MKKRVKWVFIVSAFALVLLGIWFIKKNAHQEDNYYAAISTEVISNDYLMYHFDSKHLNNGMAVYGIEYDIESKKYGGNIFCYNHETKKNEILAIDRLGDKLIQEFRIGNEGIYILTLEQGQIWGIQVYDKEGKYLREYNIGEIEDNAEISGYRFWDVDAKGNLVILDSKNCLNVFNGEDGQKIKSLSLEEKLIDAYISEDNQLIYLSQTGQSSKQISVVDYMDGEEEKILFDNQEVADDILGIYSGGKGKVVISGNLALYELDIKKERANKIFEWLEVSVDNTYTKTIVKEDNIYYVYNVRNGSEQGELEVIQLVKRYGENPIKIIEIAAAYANQDLKELIVDFNKSHSDVKARLKLYGTDENASVRYDKMIKDLNSNTEIDVVVLDPEYYEILAKNGAFQELDSYIQANGLEEKLISSVVNAYKVNEKTYAVMDRFTVGTILGRKSIFNEDKTYTLKEILDIANGNEKTLYCGDARNEVLSIFLRLNVGREKIQQMLPKEFEYAVQYAQKIPADYVEYDTDALLERVGLGQRFYMDFALFRAGHGEEFSIVGFPTEDKEGTGAIFGVENIYAINAKSEKKDEAWLFIQELWDDERQWEISGDFPINKEIFEEKLYDVMDRTDKEKGVILQTGDTKIEAPIEEVSISDVERMKQLVYETDQYSYLDEALFNIITEETGAYYAGQKSLEEVMEIIENRVNIYYEESKDTQ